METSLAHYQFNSLMQSRVRSILLITSIYDQFMFEEDGRIEEQIRAEYAELNLTNPPRFKNCNSGKEALEMIEAGERFDLIITLFNIGSITPFEFSKQVKQIVDIPIVLLTSFSHDISRRLSETRCDAIDYIFGWQGNADLIMAIIKMIEDKNNAKFDMLEGGVQGILLVEDSVKFYSAYLPKLYSIIIRQMDLIANETLNSKWVMMYKRTRPKILFARTLEQAQEMFNIYGNNLLGIISDIAFPNSIEDCNVSNPTAGIELCELVRGVDLQLPIMLQSSESKVKDLALSVGADFADKNSPLLFDLMNDFVKNKMAFGDFVFHDPGSGREVCRASSLAQLQECASNISDEILIVYANRNMFSKWLFARGLFDMANMFKCVKIEDFESPNGLRSYIVDIIEHYRMRLGQGALVEFDRSTYNKYVTFARTARGSLGGKARGLAFINNLLERNKLTDRWSGVVVSIPRTFAVTTYHFDLFLQYNALGYILTDDLDDSEILAEFMAAKLDDELLRSLRVFVSSVKGALAIRSSSKLEDSHYQPFAGVYSTYMVPCVDNEDKMLRLVARAIKSVYASVFFRSSRRYIEASGNILEEEKMAVVIQEVCGTDRSGLFYPTFSGVARSINYYPLGDERSDEGICNLVVGLGKGAVEGGVTMRFSPAHPRHALQLTTPEISLRDTQKSFWALDMNPGSFKLSTDDGINLKRIELSAMEQESDLRYVASTWNVQDGRMADNVVERGRRIATFAAVLKYDIIPVPEIVSALLELGRQALHSPVEIEFAVNANTDGRSVIFNVLQIRPIAEPDRESDFDWSGLDLGRAILYSDNVLGFGDVRGVRDVVYVKQDVFDPSYTVEIAQQIAQINSVMVDRREEYVLVGPGRWGSSDSWLGIPVKWADICNAKVIVECNSSKFNPDPSQGTHFFQNLTSFGVGYLTINPELDRGVFAVERMDKAEVISETKWLRHVRFANELSIAIDSSENRAVIFQN